MASSSIDSACDLGGVRLEERLAMIRRELLPRVRHTRELPDGVVWEFAPSPELRECLERFVVFERKCCGGLQWNLRDGPGVLELHVGGVRPDALLEAIAEPRGTRSHVRRLAASTGLGVGSALLVCCVLPIGVALTFGAAAAAPLLWLDQPSVLLPVSLALGAAAWIFLRRRSAASGCGDGC